MNEAIRKDFPLLRQKTPLCYLDSACVTMRPQTVIAAINEYYEQYPSCGGRSSHQLGRRVTEQVDDARKTLKKFFGAKKEEEILFTKNTTEGINLVAQGTDLRGGAVLTTDKEHNSNLVPWLRLAKENKTRHLVAPTKEGVIDLEAYEQLLGEDVSLVAINHVSNIDGIINPVQKLAKLAHKAGARILVDGAQAAGHQPVDVRTLGADYYAVSGHKMLGPSGTGLLYVKKEHYADLRPITLGGDTVNDTWLDRYELRGAPQVYEAGLQDYAGIQGLRAAADYLERVGRNKIHKHAEQTTKTLTRTFDEYGLKILNPGGTGIISVIPERLPAQELSLLLDQQGILTRAGAFCVHSYFNKHDLKPAVRFSPYLYNTEEDLERVEAALKDLKDIL